MNYFEFTFDMTMQYNTKKHKAGHAEFTGHDITMLFI